MDGNVARVTHRLFGIPGDSEIGNWTWDIMDRIVQYEDGKDGRLKVIREGVFISVINNNL